MADQDNENDEYHAPVPIVDVWMECKRLADRGWQVRRIADAKDVAVGKVSERIGYAAWPEKIHAMFTKGLVNESHAREIDKLSHCEHSVWLDWQTSVFEIMEAALKKGGTAKHFAENGHGGYSHVRARCELWVFPLMGKPIVVSHTCARGARG